MAYGVIAHQSRCLSKHERRNIFFDRLGQVDCKEPGSAPRDNLSALLNLMTAAVS
jgi:hypothetical protein